MIEVIITPNMRKIARDEAKELGKLKNSILGGKGNETGVLGELAVVSLDGFSRLSSYHYDVVSGDEKKWDVKTKKRSVPVLPHYHATVADFNTTQLCYGYIFVSIYDDIAQIIGCMKKEDFYKKANFYKLGEPDPSSNYSWAFKADCYNIRYSELKEFK